MTPITIGDQTFPSLSLAKNYTVALIRKYRDREYVGAADKKFISELVELHPNPIYRGKSCVFQIEVGTHDARHVVMEYIEGGKLIRHLISLNKCLGLTKESQATLLTDAMRATVIDQIRAFVPKENICAGCGGTELLQVDHHPVRFADIKKAYIGTMQEEQIPTEFDDCENGKGVKLKNDNLGFEYGWKIFHAQHAQYRLLCRPCNSSHKYEVAS